MSNECPDCGQEAMSNVDKLLRRPFACRHCGTTLRLNLVYTGVLSLLYFFIVIQLLLRFGTLGMGMAYVLGVTLIYIGLCMVMPLEKGGKPAG